MPTSRSVHPTSPASPAGPERIALTSQPGPAMTKPAAWVAGARPRTLPIAVVPVLVGTAVAAAEGRVIWWRSAAALVVSLALQVGVNYANDFSDGVRGTDAARVGPLRLVAGGLASPQAVRRAAFISFAVSGLAGLALVLATSPWLLAVGAASIAAAWFYTGGPRPYGYAGFGEVFVFVFFGLVAVAGTAYVSLSRVTGLAVLAGVPVGLLAVSVLVVNNLRDIPTDAEAGKRTLAVRLGDGATRWLYIGCLLAAFATAVAVAADRRLALIVLPALALAAIPVRDVGRGASGRQLVAVLVMTGRLVLVFGVLFAAGIAW